MAHDLPGGLALNYAETMLENLFLITYVDFLPNGVLRPVLHCAFASLIMYYPQTIKEFGMDHALTILAIRNAAIASNIMSMNERIPHNVLIDWAKIVDNDFKQRNANS